MREILALVLLVAIVPVVAIGMMAEMVAYGCNYLYNQTQNLAGRLLNTAEFSDED